MTPETSIEKSNMEANRIIDTLKNDLKIAQDKLSETMKVTQDICILFWKGDKLVAIERKNGQMERYMTKEANFGDAAELFNAHTAELPKKTV